MDYFVLNCKILFYQFSFFPLSNFVELLLVEEVLVLGWSSCWVLVVMLVQGWGRRHWLGLLLLIKYHIAHRSHHLISICCREYILIRNQWGWRLGFMIIKIKSVIIIQLRIAI